MAMPTATRTDVRPRPASTDVQLRPGLFWRWVWTSVRPFRGHVLLIAGFVFLLLGYLGVSREVLVARQIPYLVSGGLVGVAIVAVGSRYLLVSAIQHDAERLERVEEAVQELRDLLLTYADEPTLSLPDEQRHTSTSPHSANPMVLVLDEGERFHWPGCAIVEGKESISAISPTVARQNGFQPCPMCDPAGQASG